MKTEFTGAGVEVEAVTWAQFKALIAKRGLKIKYALTEAIRLWLKAQRD